MLRSPMAWIGVVTIGSVAMGLCGCSGSKSAPVDLEDVVENLIDDGSLEESRVGIPRPTAWRAATSDSTTRSSVVAGGRTGWQLLAGETPHTIEIYHDRPKRGQRYRARCWMQIDPGTNAALVLSYLNAEGSLICENQCKIEGKADQSGWHQVAVPDPAPGDAPPAALSLHILFSGTGNVVIDDLELVSEPSLPIVRNLLHNDRFENVVDASPLSWRISKDGGPVTWEATQDNPFEGWHCLHLKGEVNWVVIGSEKIPVDRQRKYVLSGMIRAGSGSAQLKIDYYERGKYVGSTESPGVNDSDWRPESVAWEPERFPNADHITAAAVGNGKIDAWFDNLVLQDQ